MESEARTNTGNRDHCTTATTTTATTPPPGRPEQGPAKEKPDKKTIDPASPAKSKTVDAAPPPSQKPADTKDGPTPDASQQPVQASTDDSGPGPGLGMLHR